MTLTQYSVWKWILLWNSLIASGAIQVRLIDEVSFHVPVWSSRVKNRPVLNGTCQECLCALLSKSHPTKSNSFNCFNYISTCEFFASGTFYQFWLTSNTNSRFYFLEVPTSEKHSFISLSLVDFIQKKTSNEVFRDRKEEKVESYD